MVSERHHIEYQFSGLEDENGSNIDYDHDESNDDDNDTDDGTATTDDGELSFDYGQNDPVVEVSTLACSMEVGLEFVLILIQGNSHVFEFYICSVYRSF